MFRTLKNAWNVPELRTKLLFTLLIIVIYRLGASIIVPFCHPSGFDAEFGSTTLGFLNILSGGALSQATLFALSVSPYITASIVMQLLSIAIPALERMAKDEDGKKKINTITRFVTVALAIVTAYGYTTLLDSNGWLTITSSKVFVYFVIISCFCAGASVIMWLADKINEKGIGNGISIILFANIIARVPSMIMQLIRMAFPKFMYSASEIAQIENKLGTSLEEFSLVGLITAICVFLCLIGLIVLSVWFTNSERRIPIQYAKRVVGRKMYGGQGTNLPLKMNMAGVMPIIFASSIVSIPGTIVSMFGMDTARGFGWFVTAYLQPNTWTYIVLYLIMLVAFSYFYIMISFNPVEVANNIRNNGGAVPGIRPGKPTVDYIKRILNRVTLIGAVFLGVIACVSGANAYLIPLLRNVYHASRSTRKILLYKSSYYIFKLCFKLLVAAHVYLKKTGNIKVIYYTSLARNTKSVKFKMYIVSVVELSPRYHLKCGRGKYRLHYSHCALYLTLAAAKGQNIANYCRFYLG